jgi:acetyl-CoA carboxylase biotin carboxylase subunit
MFRKILVANRGEIALRIFRACRELGARSVAIYSEVDRGAPWARIADESYQLNGVTARETYLNQEAIFAIANRAGVDAIHPGYGFLSENADFAEACAQRDIHFIGPTPAAMRELGSKAGARELAGKVNVPIIPGVDGQGYSDEALQAAAAELGYPVLIKASAGGGGKGMRVVEAASDFADALRAARNESISSFGSDHILVEKYFTQIRHVEVQILGDRHGNIVHLFERECSVQRRHQKIVEETPSPVVTPELRRQMCAAALALAGAVGYVSAGTVEFMVTADGRYFFLEMNTRLQVEHPITELVAGLDLAAWQIRLAAGEPLSFSQEQVSQRGHALECRVYAEDPARNFLPSIGDITFYRRPAGPGVRVDDGIESGSVVSPYYDPMLAKVITWGADRPEAIRKMVRALQDTVILGVTTNIPYLLAILAQPAFLEGKTTTDFIAQRLADWQPEPDTSRSTWLAIAALETLMGSERGHRPASKAAGETTIADYDPWRLAGDWRNVPLGD